MTESVRKPCPPKPSTSASQLRKGVLELAVLALISRGPIYGSKIVESLEHRPGLSISVGTIYPLLARLKSGGLIDSTWEESPVGPPRKYYVVTEPGRHALEELSVAWQSIRDDVDDILGR